MNNDSFLIEEFDLDYAKNICKLIENPEIRNKAVANVAAASFAKKYFQDCEVDTETGLHNICKVLEDIDISDIYIKNNYIDVRLYFNDNELFVPKSHFDNNLLPVAYMFIKVGEDLSNGLVTGFITPAAIDTTKEFNGYYHVNEDELISFYDVESNLVHKYEEDLPENIESLIFDYLDNKLTNKNDFYKTLIDSKEARTILQKAAKAKIIFNFVSIPASEDVVEEPINETVDLLEDTSESDFSLGETVLEEFETIEETSPLELDDFSLDNSDSMLLDTEEEITPFEEISIDTEPVEEEDNEEEESTYLPEEPAMELNEDFDTDSIQMLGAGEYEAQPIQDFSEDLQEEVVIDEDNASINMLDSSTLTFEDEEAPAIEPEIVVEDTASLDIIEEPDNELPIEETVQIDEPVIENPVEETNDFDFSTNVTPSIDTFEEQAPEQDEIVTELTEDSLEDVIEEEVQEEVNPAEQENAEQIDTLFNQEEPIAPSATSKPKNLLVPIIGVIAVLAAIGYYSYTKFVVPQQTGNDIVDNTQNAIQTPEAVEQTQPVEDAMPVETVENVKVQLNTNEGNAVSIPAIEQNLDASITVSNLRVEFEIPAGYKASKTAERYFTKMGKIVQLNLKTELLLLTKQPITNKIAVELEYNKGTQKFDVKGLLASSGEQSIDDLILNTVKSALNINLNMNMSVFGNVAGNPVLVIKL